MSSKPRKQRKSSKRLGERIADFDKMTGRSDFRAPFGAYHKPGSNKK